MKFTRSEINVAWNALSVYCNQKVDEFELLHEQYKSETEFFSKQTTEVERNIKDLKTCYNAMTKVLSEMRNDRYRDLLSTSLEESKDELKKLKMRFESYKTLKRAKR